MSTKSGATAVAQTTSGSVFKGAMLISGTMIGGGMLAMPVASASAGFVPSIFVYLTSWFAMALSGLLIFEVNLWMKGESNLVSMAERTLGVWGKMATWVLYLFLFYCLMTAYVSGVASFFRSLAPELFGGPVGLFVASLCFLPVLIRGTQLVSKLNVWLIGGLCISYFLFLFLGAPYVDGALLGEGQWTLAVSSFPVVFTAFSYQGIVPTLSNYYGRDPVKMRKAVWIGTTVTLVTYLLWQMLILGIVPHESLARASSAIEPMKEWLISPYVETIGQSFAFFALFTSFLGVALGLIDFLADGLKIQKDFRGKLLLGLMVLVPPVIFNLLWGNLFIRAIEYAGGIGCALLLGLIPVLMVWKGREMFSKSSYRVKGGKGLLILLGAFFCFEVALELYTLI